MRAMRPAFGLAVAVTLALGLAHLAPRPGAAVAIVFPPGMPEQAALAALLADGADWRPLGFGRFPLPVIYAHPGAAVPAAPAGALLVLGLPGGAGCMPRPGEGSRA